ncbi:zinc-ribbon and DUF3426 domain-containing protein [Xenophilus sp. Marseille-Q4582]|uniref:zinc-ribbon and DUF3426 domain-containing protein n=1 Tax=Xenophilus sp. Marseille-Q4582 TaxID=2866600 RepID=UPI001CE4986B|nr:zinc-ribbon and DUF3426 domain-containing protein [Xenophilus sp. Marseille-Q4582]
MSLVTRCPACTTTFKVVRDQLRISDGWVRCGRCSEVFDATLDLLDTDTGEPVPAHSFVSPKPPPLDEAAPLRDASGTAQAAGEMAPATGPFDTLPSDLPRFGPEAAVVSPPAANVPAPAPMSAPIASPPTAWPAAGLLDLPERPASPSPAPAPAPAPTVQVSGKAGAELEAPAPAGPAWRRIQVPPAPPSAPSIAGVMADEPWPMRRASAPQETAPPASSSAIEAAVDAQLQKALRRARVQALREERARLHAEDRPGPAKADKADKAGEPPDALSASVLRRASTDSVSATDAEGPAPADSMLDSTLYAAEFLDAPPDSFAAPPAARRRLSVGTWGVLALLAGVLLLAQWLRHERDALAASQPALRPAIQALCEVSGCVPGAPRRIDAVRIDGSSFTPSRQGERYELMFTLRNAAALPVAMPSIELSLLDGNERPVVRRVFHPRDFGAPPQMGPRGEQMAQLHLSLQVPPEQRAQPVMGYSMLAFYP